jgi:uncharacterized protein YaiL (DUF2058 family)
MGNTLQDQLLKAGLVDKNKANKANKANKELRKQSQKQRNKKTAAAPSSEQLRQREKAKKDRELNLRREEARKQREIAQQIKQLVDSHRHPRSNSDDDNPFYFNNKGKVKHIYVSADTHSMITTGKLVIVNCNGVFELVPKEIAEKIRKRNPSLVIDLSDEQPPSEDDPYADFQVPDDLIW